MTCFIAKQTRPEDARLRLSSRHKRYQHGQLCEVCPLSLRSRNTPFHRPAVTAATSSDFLPSVSILPGTNADGESFELLVSGDGGRANLESVFQRQEGVSLCEIERIGDRHQALGTCLTVWHRKKSRLTKLTVSDRGWKSAET